jgi:hypothetical protein
VQEHAVLVLGLSLIQESYEAGVFVNSSDATIEHNLIDKTLANAEGGYGDGIVVISYADLANATIEYTHIVESERAAVSAHGAHVTMKSSTLACQAIDIDYETYQGIAGRVEDLGDNLCGCPEPNAKCKGVSANLAPPPPVEPPPQL